MTDCPRCGESLTLADRFCPKCGADTHIEGEIAARYEPALQTARKWILAVGIIYVVSALLMIAITGDQMTDLGKQLILGINGGLCAIHIGLWVWAKKAPFPAAVVALVLFITVQLIDFATDPTQVYKGILIKVLFLVALIKAVQAGLEAHKLRSSRS